MGDPLHYRNLEQIVTDDTIDTIKNVVKSHRQKWPILKVNKQLADICYNMQTKSKIYELARNADDDQNAKQEYLELLNKLKKGDYGINLGNRRYAPMYHLSSWQLRCQWGSFAAHGVACGHASSRLENIVEADRRSLVWRFGESGGSCQVWEFSYRYGNSRNRFLVPKNIRKDTKHDGFRLREKFGKSREVSNRFGNSRNRFPGLENIGKDTKHGGFML
ncbi:hypothetical protein NQ317_015562 [Molorchus minor]|uniref:Uncharacterized protein n=1 Tax=Molorchus minor TaxID=1323400 RepID=A0ABQ9IRF4_9CUCU|nr:hypothetical protein NQ317_015562 [Molorchus minor]